MDSFTAACLAVGGTVCLASCFFFLFRIYPQYLHSDSAGIVLLAEEILRSGQWIPANWYYVSDSVAILDSPQLALPFVAALGVSALALASAASCGAAIFLMSSYALGRAAGLQRPLAAAASLLMVCGASMIYSDILLGMMITVPLAESSFLLLMVAAAMRARNHLLPVCVCAAVLALMFATNPRKALLFHALPTIAALMVCAFSARGAADSELFRERGRFLLTVIFVSSCVGGMVHTLLVHMTHMNDSYAQFRPSLSPAMVADNARIFGNLLMMFLGVSENGSGSGVVRTGLSAYRAISAVAMLGLFFLGARLAFKRDHRTIQFFTAFAASTTVLIVLALLTGDKIKEYYGIYYLIFAAAPAIVVSFYGVANLSRGARNAVLLAFVAPALLLSARYHVFGDPSYRGPGINQLTSHAQKTELISWLEHEGLRDGYSTFWEANAITVSSRGRIRLIPASIWFDNFGPFKWWVSDREIARIASQRPVFIAIPHARKRALTGVCAQGAAVHELTSYRVYVFKDGLAHCLRN